MDSYVSWFVNSYINDFSNLCKRFETLINCEKMPTSCTIFARVIFYALFKIDPNGDSPQIKSSNIDTVDSIIPNIRMMMDGNLHKIDIWVDNDVIHAFVIYYNGADKFKIAQSYGDDDVCIKPAIYDIR